MKNTIIVGVILFVIGALIGFGVDRAYMKRKSAAGSQQMDQKVAENSQEKAGPNPIVDQGNSMATDTTIPPSLTGEVSASTNQNLGSVEDQKPGDRVVIKSVVLGTIGWVVIHDDNNGKPGHILGAHRFNAGTYTGQVELLKATEEGKVYYAMLHADNGDKQFDYRTDLPINDAGGNPVMMRFVATAKPTQ